MRLAHHRTCTLVFAALFKWSSQYSQWKKHNELMKLGNSTSSKQSRLFNGETRILDSHQLEELFCIERNSDLMGFIFIFGIRCYIIFHDPYALFGSVLHVSLNYLSNTYWLFLFAIIHLLCARAYLRRHLRQA